MNGELIYPENDYRDFLEHHGIPGMRWGVRRYQNADGSLTTAGKLHAAKTARKERDRKIQDRVFREEEKIESKYKKGQTLSDEDFAKQEKADKRASDAWNASKQRYKSEVKAIKSEARANAKAEKAAKRREKILNNPKLLKKHFNEYSDKEINDALKKFDQMQRLDAHYKNKSTGAKVKKALAATVAVSGLVISGVNNYSKIKGIPTSDLAVDAVKLYKKVKG